MSVNDSVPVAKNNPRVVDTFFYVIFNHDKFGSCTVQLRPPAKNVDKFILDSLDYFEKLPGVDPQSVSFDFYKSLRSLNYF